MPYSPPSGSAANFSTPNVDFPRPYNGLGFKLPAASYSAPAGNNVQAQFLAAPADWTPPAGNAANFTDYNDIQYAGNGAVVVPFSAVGLGEAHAPSAVGTGAATVDFAADGLGAHGVAATAAAPVGFAAAGFGAHGVAGSAAVTAVFSCSGSATVLRYELRGEVRLHGMLVNRRVRAYRRASGDLVGEADTVAGRFHVHAGFDAGECYVVPIDLSAGADDWAPPVANRVVPVLAQDTV